MSTKAVQAREPEAIQYTVRGVPLEVDRVLRERAARSGRSLNQVIVDELVRATGAMAPRADFSDLVGKWVPDPGFDEVMEAQRQIDWAKWR